MAHGSPDAATRGTVAGQTAWQLVARVYGLFSLLIVTAVLARNAEDDVFGAYGLAVLLAAVIAVPLDAGLGQTGVAAATANRALLGGLIRLRFVAAVAGGVGFVLIGLVLIATGSSIAGLALTFGSAMAALNTVAAAALTTAQVDLRNNVAAAANVLAQTVGLAVSIALIANSPTLHVVLLTLPLAAGIRAVVCVAAAVRSGLWRWGSLPRGRRALVMDAASLTAWNIVGSLHVRMSALVVYIMLGAAGFAPFALSLRLLDVFLVAPSLLLGVAFPVLVSTRVNDPDRFARIRQDLFDALGTLGMLGAALIVVSAPLLVTALGGSDLPDAVPLLMLYGVAAGSIWMNTLFVTLMILQGQQRAGACLGLVSLLINAVSAALLVSAVGAVGAAAASAISEALLTVSMFVLVFRGFGRVRLRLFIRSALVVAVATAAGLLATSASVLVAMLITLGVAAAGFVLLRVPVVTIPVSMIRSLRAGSDALPIATR